MAKTRKTKASAPSPVAATEFRKLPIGQVKPAPYNPRVKLKRTDAEFIKLQKSITQFGVVEPIVWNQRTGHAVGGHQRLSVLKTLKYTHVDVAVVDLPLEQEKVLNIALNKISGKWDMPKLNDLIEELAQLEGDLVGSTGFDEGEMDALLAEAEAELLEDESDEDDADDNEDDQDEADDEDATEPVVKEKTIPTTFQLVADFDDEEHQQEVYHLLIEKGIRVKVITVN